MGTNCFKGVKYIKRELISANNQLVIIAHKKNNIYMISEP